MAKKDLSPLVTAAQQGDEQALSDLLEACYQDLYFYAYQTVKNEDLAADITQESCLEIISTISQLREPNAFVVWARRITYHQCTRHFRESKEITVEANEDGETIFDRIVDESEGALPEQVQLDKEFRATMQQLLDELPAQQRTALMLYYYEKLSVGQIAQIQDTTEGTVKSRLNYGRKAVKAKVEEYEKKTGTRLHSIAPLPLLLFFLFGRQGAEALASSSLGALWQTISGNVAAGTAATIGTGTAVGTAAGTAAATGAATTGAGAAAATGAATTAAAAVGTSLGVKIAAGAIAAAVCIGGAVGGAALIENATAKVPKELRGTWYGEQYTEAHPNDVLVLEADGTLQYHGYTFDLFSIEPSEDNPTGKDMELYFQYETTRPDCGTCTHSGVHLSFQWVEDNPYSSIDMLEPGYLLSVYPGRGYHANGEEAVAPFYEDPADAYYLFHHYYRKDPLDISPVLGEWIYKEGDSSVKSFTVHPDHRLVYGDKTYIWKLNELYDDEYGFQCGFAVYDPPTQYREKPCCLRHVDDHRLLFLDIYIDRCGEYDDFADVRIVGGSEVTFVRPSSPDTPTAPSPSQEPTEIITDTGISIPAQYLGHWESFPDEEQIISYCQSNEDGTYQIYDSTYYVIYAQPTTILLAKDPNADPRMATAKLVFHDDTFGIPAIEFQKLYPDDDKEPRTLDYFWRSADLEQLEAVTLTDDNWKLYINNSPGDQNGPVDNIILNSDCYTHFYFKSFVFEGSRAESNILRTSFLVRDYKIDKQWYWENIPGSEYPSDQRIGLDSKTASVGVPNVPDGVSGGRAVEREVSGETVRYYEQFSSPAELQNVTGTVRIPQGFDAEAWLAANE